MCVKCNGGWLRTYRSHQDLDNRHGIGRRLPFHADGARGLDGTSKKSSGKAGISTGGVAAVEVEER